MSTMHEITEQLRASNFEHVRAVIEPDDVVVLVAYLEGRGYISSAALTAMEADNAVYEGFLKSRKLTLDQAHALTADEQAAIVADYNDYLASPEGIKAVEADRVAKEKAAKAEADAEAKADADAEKAAAKAEKDAKK